MAWEKLRGKENKLQLTPNISFKPKKLAYAQFCPWLDTIYDWYISEEKKKIYPEGKNLSIYFPPCDNQKSFFALYFDFVFAREQNGSWQKMVHVNKFLIVLDYIEAACCEISL